MNTRISEVVPFTPVERRSFPQRNRSLCNSHWSMEFSVVEGGTLDNRGWIITEAVFRETFLTRQVEVGDKFQINTVKLFPDNVIAELIALRGYVRPLAWAIFVLLEAHFSYVLLQESADPSD